MTDRAELLQAEKALKEIERSQREEKLFFYAPYPKQQEFHDLGLTKRERLLMAGNQNGKTWCGGAEAAYHMTGLYPDWWLGRRWDRPTRGWVAGVTGESTRDNPQRILLGTTAQIEEYGPGLGLIPKRALDPKRITAARGVANLYDTVLVRHYKSIAAYHANRSDGWSEMKFKSYEKGATKLQGDTLDWEWCDEEPPEDIYSEMMARITATNGIIYVTFTPLQGMSKVVTRFTDEPSPDRSVVTMTIDDAKHIPDEQKAKIIAGFLPHEREARARGVPVLGSGKVFKATEESITITPFSIPRHWSLLWGMDFGLNHPFATVLFAWDKEMDTIYVVKCIRMADTLPLQHAEAMKPCLNNFGWKIPAAWPQDGWQRKEFGGELLPLAAIYRKHGVKMLYHHATFPDGSNSTEAGILGMQEVMANGHFKVFSDCTEWFDEYRQYHRKDGQLVRFKDDLMSATRVGWMARRFARSVLWVPNTPDGRAPVAMAKDIDIDPWGD